MATRSLITIKYESGFDGIYCHFDGHPDRMLPELEQYFSSRESVNRLLDGGDASSIKKGEVNYYNSRGENTTKFENFEFEEMIQEAKDVDAEYVYIFDGDFPLGVKDGWTYLKVSDY